MSPCRHIIASRTGENDLVKDEFYDPMRPGCKDHREIVGVAPDPREVEGLGANFKEFVDKKRRNYLDL
jgi:hypothetical protein